MSRTERSTEEVPGWIILSPGAVPEVWRSRAVPTVLVPLNPDEASQLLSGEPVKQGISADDLPLMHLLASGLTAAEIARELHISVRTVYRRVTRLRHEFSLSTMEAVATELAKRGF